MPREYRNISQYEKEIIELWEQGKTLREIGEMFGFTKNQVQDFKTRYNIRQRKLAAGMTLKRKGRPRKDGNELPPSIQRLSKLIQLQYEIARQERHIKQLKMENVLMRDFLSLTEGSENKCKIYGPLSS